MCNCSLKKNRKSILANWIIYNEVHWDSKATSGYKNSGRNISLILDLKDNHQPKNILRKLIISVICFIYFNYLYYLFQLDAFFMYIYQIYYLYISDTLYISIIQCIFYFNSMHHLFQSGLVFTSIICYSYLS